MYYLTYKDFDTGFLFNYGEPVARKQVQSLARRMFDEFGDGQQGRAAVLVRNESDTIISKIYPDPTY